MKIQQNWLHTNSPECDQATHEQTHKMSSNIITSYIKKKMLKPNILGLFLVA